MYNLKVILNLREKEKLINILSSIKKKLFGSLQKREKLNKQKNPKKKTTACTRIFSLQNPALAFARLTDPRKDSFQNNFSRQKLMKLDKK